MYIIATDVFQKAPQKSIMEDRPLVSEILRLNSASQVVGLKRQLNYPQTQVRIPSQRPTNFSALNVNSNASNFDSKQQQTENLLIGTIQKIWNIFETSTMRWISRFLAFLWVYMYHDWQSLLILVFLLHSTFYLQASAFRKWILYFYMPYFVVLFLWYYTINIQGLIQWDNIDMTKQINRFDYGFYQFQIPPLETTFLFSNVYFLIILADCMKLEFDDKKKAELFLNKISQIQCPTIYQAFYLSLIYVELPLMLTLIIVGLDKMDLYHIVLLMFFVVYTLYGDKIKNFAFYLLLYADFFVLEKYIYSLVMQQQNPDGRYWMQFIGISTDYNPQSQKEYFRYPPRFDQWIIVILSFLLYRRASIIGSDKVKLQIQEKRTKAIIAIKYPKLYRMAVEIDILWHYSMVLITFGLFLTIIIIQKRTVLNAINQLIVLSLMCVYFARGLKVLIDYWFILVMSTSIILVMEITYQFLLQTDVFLKIQQNNQWQLSTMMHDWLNWMGFYPLENQANYSFFFGYIILFALAVIMRKKFEAKNELEVREITFEEDDIILLTDGVNESWALKSEQKDEYRVNNSENNSFREIRPTIAVQNQINPFTESKKDPKTMLMIEYNHLKQFLEMRYKLSYLVFKIKLIWPVLDYMASYFHLIISTVVLSYALYNSIALVWGIFLIIFMIQTIQTANVHYKYRQSQQKRFDEQIQANIFDDRFDQFEIEQTKLYNSRKGLEYGGENPQNQVNQDNNYSTQKRVKVTDEEAIIEYNSFYKSIDKVTLQTRHFFWVNQYILITISITLIYFFSFAEFWNITWTDNPISQILYNKIIFAAFLAGFYTDVTKNEYFVQASPFYVMLALLVCEKLAQNWLIDKLGCDEEICIKYKRMIAIHENYKKFKNNRKSQQNQAINQDQKLSFYGSLLLPSPEQSIKKNDHDLSPILEERESFLRSSMQIYSSPLESKHASKQNDDQEILEKSFDRDAYLAFDRDSIYKEDFNPRQSRSLTVDNKKSKAMVQKTEQQQEESPFTVVTKKKEELLEKIRQKFEIKSKIKILNAFKSFLEDVVILLVWVSCIYKENILSLVLFLVLAFFTFSRSGTSVLIIRYTVVIIFVLEYFTTLLCLSSYNSPQALPPQITVNGIYPNDEDFFFYIPAYFGWQKIRDPYILIKDISVNLSLTTYLAFPADRSRLNGMWIDYSVILLILIYFNFCNFWLLFQPTEIVRSKTTNSEIAQYIDYCQQLQQKGGERKEKLTEEKCISDLEQQFAHVRTTETLKKFVFTYYHLLMIAFLLAVSIFNGSLLSFGYFLACMYLIFDQKNLLTEYEARVRMQNVLRNFLMPYLLLDIGLNLIYQIPIIEFDGSKKETWAEIIGFSKIWEINPQTLSLGENVQVTETKVLMTSYMMKGLTFFFISTMLQILSSYEFCEFQDTQISKLKSNQNKIGTGLAYRFNNFKCKTVINQAKEVEHISKMLAHVKKLIKKREKLYSVKKDRKDSLDKTFRKNAQNYSTFDQPIVEEMSDQEENDKQEQFDRDKFDKEEQTKIKEIYEEQLSKLSSFYKFYLYLRRNFVSDIYFRYSEEHLDDIVEQLQQGQTSIKSKLEIGTLYEAQMEYLKQVEEERNFKTQNEVDEFIEEQFDATNDKFKEDNVEEEDFNIVPKRSSSVQLRPTQLILKQKNDQQLIQEEIPIPVTTEEEIAIKNQKKRLLQQSDKPWEKVNLDSNLDIKRMISRYFVLMHKMIVSYSELFCYFWMLYATFANGGALYMFYPLIIFGYALLLEERPGKWFWYLALTYTQIMIILNFTIMLTLWETVLSPSQYAKCLEFFQGTNLGLNKSISKGNWLESLSAFFPEIMIIGSIMTLIMQQTLSGVLGIPFREFESFENGLLRYRLNMQSDESEKREILAQHGQTNALKLELDKNEIDKFRPRTQRRYSEVDKFAYSTMVLGQPIMMRLDLDFIDTNGASDDLKVEIINEKNKKRRLLSADAIRQPGFQTQEKKSILRQAGGFLYQVSNIFWDNKFFESIFPLIKQQKPGKDLYVWLFLVQFIICLYILFFFSNMLNQQNSIATQFSNNSLSAGMVLTLFSMIFVMVIDRVIYSTHTFLAFAERNEEISAQSTNEQSNLDKQFANDNILMQKRQSILSATSYRNKNDIYSGKEFTDQNWLDNRLAIPDDGSDTSERVKEFADALVPQKQQKRGSRVLRIYFLWTLLVIVHYFIFFYLPNTILYCIRNPYQPKSGATISYGEPGYQCNTFTNNGYLQCFYVLWLIYFFLAAYQLQVGLPELRKGSFMVGEYDTVSCYIFRAYLAIPFIFELRSIIDWTFTTTALDVFQWIKLAQIQANFYVNKCINAGYFTKKLGEKIGLFYKITNGFLLMLVVLALLVGPILLFSSINPVGQFNQVNAGILDFKIGLQNLTSGSVSDVQLFYTSQLTQNTNMTSTTFDQLGFNNYQTTTAQFSYSASQVVQFSPASDSVWTISPAKKNLLLNTLQATLNQTNSNIEVSAVFTVGFTRVNKAVDTKHVFQSSLITNNTISLDIINGLINQISCNKTGFLNSSDPIVTQFPELVIITQKADQNSNLQSLATLNPVFTTGFNLSYYCDENILPNDPNSYWTLTQVFNSTVQPQTTVDLIEQNVFFGSGFGFFVFNQKVLPSYLSAYSTSILVFYISVVYVIASLFRSAFVPMTWEIFIWDAPFNDDILMICQSIHIYRVQMELEKEEELYMILIDIMRSPEMIKSLCGSSLKKKLE